MAEWTDVGRGYTFMTSTSGNEALDKGHAISYVKDCPKLPGIQHSVDTVELVTRYLTSKTSKIQSIQYSIGTVELGKFLRYIESSSYRTPRFNEFSKKQPKCSLYRGTVNN